MVNRIITADDYAKREGAKNIRERIKRHIGKITRQYPGVTIRHDLDNVITAPVYACIYRGSWIAYCECRGAEFVTPSDPIFYCLSCYNRSHGGRARPVVFPKNREEIEALVLQIPVIEAAGFDDASIAEHSQPMVADEAHPFGFARSWQPGDTIKQMKLELAEARRLLRAKE